MLTDIRYALRQMTKNPGYTTVVVLTLAFGIAVNTQIFSMIGGIFFQPMPVRDHERLTIVVERSDMFNMPHGISFLDFQDIRNGSKNLTSAIAYFFTPAHVAIQGQAPERAWVEAVTPDAFEKMGVSTILGRPLQPADGELPPGVPVAVLTHRMWQNRFGADPSIVGRTIQIDAKPFTIVGVAKPGFDSFSYAVSVGLFVPSGTFPMLRADGAGFFQSRAAKAWKVLGYRAPGATIADVNAELAVFAQRFAKDFPQEHRKSRFQAADERRARPDPGVIDLLPVFLALFSALVLLVLFIACANVANLMGTRALAREKELVVRAALGASRARIIRQLLIESLLLAGCAGVVGYILADLGGAALQNFMPQSDAPLRQDIHVGGSLVIFTGAISLIAGFAAGIVPALRASRVDLNESLKQGASRGATGSRHGFRNFLVIGQVAVSCVVLICAALFLRGLKSAANQPIGFKTDRLLMLSTDLSLQGYDQERGLRFQKQALDDIRALPGVESAGFAQHIPFNYNIVVRQVFPENPSVHIPDDRTAVGLTACSPGFVTMLGSPLLRGRDLNEADDARAPHAAVINQAMADAFWPGRDPLGQHFRMNWNGAPVITVVGVVATGKYVMLTEEPKPYFYVPFSQYYDMPATLVVRGKADPQALVPSLRAAIHRLDPDLPIYSLVTLEQHMNSSFFALMPLRSGAILAGIQGVIGLLLAVLGLYTVVSYSVSSRTREIGVRMALGATHRDVMKLVSRQGLRLTIIGLASGAVLAVALSFGLARVVFGVRPADPIAFIGVLAILLTTAAVACWLPARRATRVDPIMALRAE